MCADDKDGRRASNNGRSGKVGSKKAAKQARADKGEVLKVDLDAPLGMATPMSLEPDSAGDRRSGDVRAMGRGGFGGDDRPAHLRRLGRRVCLPVFVGHSYLSKLLSLQELVFNPFPF